MRTLLWARKNFTAALKALRGARNQEGIHALMSRRSHLWGYLKPSIRQRQKSGRARACERKHAAKIAAGLHFATREAKQPIMTARREEVIAAAA